MLEIKNQELWREVIAKAISAATENPGSRKVKNWVIQIGFAAKSIETNPYLNYEDGKLLVLSERSLNVYEVDEYCDCKGAVEFGQVCWHRVAKRLWEIYLEADAVQTDAVLSTEVIAPTGNLSSYNNAPYLKQGSDKKPENIGNIRI